jgi:CrcB protein
VTPAPRLVAAVAAGGALGAVLRWTLDELYPEPTGAFPWTTFAINVTGAFVLGLLPAISVVRRRQVLTVGLGPGLLGGFTTLSTYAVECRALLASGRVGLAAVYLLGTLVACLAAVALADHWSTVAERAELAAEGGDQ